jgi:hypothetical protein
MNLYRPCTRSDTATSRAEICAGRTVRWYPTGPRRFDFRQVAMTREPCRVLFLTVPRGTAQ